MDLAQTMKFSSIQLMAVPKIEGLSFSSNDSKWIPVLDAFSPISRKGDIVNFIHTIDVKHSAEDIFETVEEIKNDLEQLDQIVVMEAETYQSVCKSIWHRACIKLNLIDYTDRERQVILIKAHIPQIKVDYLIITEMTTYQAYAPLQSLMLPIRIALLATGAKTVISCPHVYGITPDQLQPGDLFIVKDHANISASSPGIGPNINEYGPRFYDITHMYDHKLVNMFKEIAPKAHTGDVFWVNNSTVIDPSVFQKLAGGLSNDKV